MDKRLVRPFKDMPGRIEGDTYIFPKLYASKSSGVRYWQIFVRVVKPDSKFYRNKVSPKVNWNILEENSLKLKDVWIYETVHSGKADLPDAVAEIYTEGGFLKDGSKITRNAPTYFDSNKNVGKINEMNALQSALVKADAEYNKKLQKGATTKLTDAEKSLSSKADFMYIPMAAKKQNDGHIYSRLPELLDEERVFAQRKLDGIRCVSAEIDGNVIMYSRSLHMLNENKFTTIRKQIAKIFAKFPGIYVDGELYVHKDAVPLQEINAIVRASKTDRDDELSYYIFDIFYVDPIKSKMPFIERLDILDKISKLMHAATDVTVIKTYELDGKDPSGDKLFKKFLDEGYEGIMYKLGDGIYQSSKTREIRSFYIEKRKPVYDDEFEVVGFDHGDGKYSRSIIWEVAYKKKTFKCVPTEMTAIEREKVYADCLKNFDKKYKGRLLTVEYYSIAKDGTPQQPKAKGFRDLK